MWPPIRGTRPSLTLARHEEDHRHRRRRTRHPDNYAAAFSREGYAVRGYPNRREAMTAFAARLPDLAVIDISLEDEPEGGFELCRDLRGMSPSYPSFS
jgi:ActR/RegA family two-component response regulator